MLIARGGDRKGDEERNEREKYFRRISRETFLL